MQLPSNPTLTDIQTYVKEQCKQRGWDERSDVERIMLLTEEVGELAKEVRKHAGKFGYRKPASSDALGDELVDVFNWLVDIANANDIDLETAFRRKWAKTDARTWDIA